MSSSKKTKQVQNEVNEVVGIMQNNIEKVMERGERLDALQNKAGKQLYFRNIHISF
jgi:vesicle-associated membrane protein 4